MSERVLVFEIDADGATCGACLERDGSHCRLFGSVLMLLDRGRYLRTDRCISDEAVIDEPGMPETAEEAPN